MEAKDFNSLDVRSCVFKRNGGKVDSISSELQFSSWLAVIHPSLRWNVTSEFDNCTFVGGNNWGTTSAASGGILARGSIIHILGSYFEGLSGAFEFSGNAKALVQSCRFFNNSEIDF